MEEKPKTYQQAVLKGVEFSVQSGQLTKKMAGEILREVMEPKK